MRKVTREQSISAMQTIEILSWLGLIVAFFMGLVVYGHQTFVTVREKEDIDKRLGRIESKQDAMLTRFEIKWQEKEPQSSK